MTQKTLQSLLNMKISKIFGSLLVSLLLLRSAVIPVTVMSTGCATIQGDPVAVRTQQAMSLAFDTMDAFVRFEHANNSKGELGPEIRDVAEKIRAGAPKWMASANIMLRTYQANRTPENKANLMTALAVLQAGAAEATKYLAK